MLKRTLVTLSLIMTLSALSWGTAQFAQADCTAGPTQDGRFGSGTVTIGVGCESTTGGSNGGTGANSDGSTASSGCRKSDGGEIPCWWQNYAWYSGFDAYCTPIDLDPASSRWDGHRDDNGNPSGTMLQCLMNSLERPVTTYRWVDTQPDTPAKPVVTVDPKTIVRHMVDSLGLHAPTIGASAYIYPGEEDWGLSWWVGAPLWLWIDANDSYQWGSHTLTATELGLSVTATITASHVTYDPGDASGAITCHTAGTPRPWNPDSPINDHSPTGCEHTYYHTNTLGDPTSRYTLSAAVTWNITWSATNGQHGTDTLTLSSTTNPAIHVGELHIIGVTPPHP